MIYIIAIFLSITPVQDTLKKKPNHPIIRTIIKDTTKQEQTIQKLDEILHKLNKKKDGNKRK